MGLGRTRRWLAALAALSCGSIAGASRAEERAVVGRLVSRDYAITLKISTRGPLYTVEGQRGEVLAADVTEAELAARHPQLWQRVHTLLAQDAGDARSIQWAGE